MKVEVLKRYFFYNSSDIVTIPKEMYKTHVNKHIFLLSRISKKLTFCREECNELLVIPYLILSVIVPLQLLFTAI
jgi:hypothetical protein